MLILTARSSLCFKKSRVVPGALGCDWPQHLVHLTHTHIRTCTHACMPTCDNVCTCMCDGGSSLNSVPPPSDLHPCAYQHTGDATLCSPYPPLCFKAQSHTPLMSMLQMPEIEKPMELDAPACHISLSQTRKQLVITALSGSVAVYGFPDLTSYARWPLHAPVPVQHTALAQVRVSEHTCVKVCTQLCVMLSKVCCKMHALRLQQASMVLAQLFVSSPFPSALTPVGCYHPLFTS